MDVLLTLVPDLRDRVANLSPSILSALLQTPLDLLADRIITLKVRVIIASQRLACMTALEPSGGLGSSRARTCAGALPGGGREQHAGARAGAPAAEQRRAAEIGAGAARADADRAS